MKQDVTPVTLGTTSSQICTSTIVGSQAWKRDDLSSTDYIVPLPPACLAEFDAVVEWLQHHPQPVEDLVPETFSLSACAAVMAQVRDRLQHQRGFAIVDRVPVERYSAAESKALGWLLAQLLGQVVAQKWDGTRLYDVRDYGKALTYGVRRSVTNLEQEFHTDGGWLTKTPEYVGLFCLHPAQEGGMSRVVSLLTVHNEMQRQHPDLLARLYRPFWWDRQAEHGPEEAKYCAQPVYAYDGHTLTGRYYKDYVLNGYKLAGTPFDRESADALTAMRAIADVPDNWVEFRVEKGQLQYLHNRQMAHSRTAFLDAAEPHLRRHLLRLWNRTDGPIDLEAQGGMG